MEKFPGGSGLENEKSSPASDDDSPEMGIQFSKRRASGEGTSGSISTGGNIDPDIQTFDAGLQQRTNRIISNLAVNVQRPSIFFDSTGFFFYMNQDAARIILECRKDIWKNSEMFQLANDYFKNNIRTSDLFTPLESSLKEARYSQLISELAIKAVGDLFTDEFYKAFKSVRKQQSSMDKKLQNRKVEKDRKLKAVNIWRNVTRIIFVSAFAALLIYSVAAALVAPPRIAAAFAVVATIPMGSMGKLLDSMWKDYQDILKAENELINIMLAGNFVVLTDLSNIIISVNRLKDYIRSSFHDAEIMFKYEDDVRLGIEEMKKKMVIFMKGIEDLVQQADPCNMFLRRARALVLQQIIKLP